MSHTKKEGTALPSVKRLDKLRKGYPLADGRVTKKPPKTSSKKKTVKAKPKKKPVTTFMDRRGQEQATRTPRGKKSYR